MFAKCGICRGGVALLSVLAVYAWASEPAADAPPPPTGAAATSETPAAAPDTTDALLRAMNRGVALMQQYAYADAVRAFERCVAAAPQANEPAVNLAIAVFNRAEPDDLARCTALLDEVLSRDPAHLRARYFKAITLLYQGRDAEALPLFEAVTQAAPRDAHAWYFVARCRSHLGQSPRAALERALALRPTLGSACYDLMRLAAQAGDAEARTRYQEQFLRLRESALCEMVVLPHYGQLGPLALVQPVPVPRSPGPAGAQITAEPAKLLAQGLAIDAAAGAGDAHVELTLADFTGDGRLDAAVVVAGGAAAGRLVLLQQRDAGRFIDSTAAAGLGELTGARSCAWGDYDNDGHVDLYVSCAGANHLLRGDGAGGFADVTAAAGAAGSVTADTASSWWADLDHDGDLDLLLCHACPPQGQLGPPVQLLRNNGDGTFADLTAESAVLADTPGAHSAIIWDADADRDVDMLLLRPSGALLARNELHGRFVPGQPPAQVSWRRGLAQDFNGDGRADLLGAGDAAPGVQLLLASAEGTWTPTAGLGETLASLARHDPTRELRAADVDLDGDLDLAVFGEAGHLLLNDGCGRFSLQRDVWPDLPPASARDVALADLTGDGAPDLLVVSLRNGGQLELRATVLTPRSHYLAVVPTGKRGDDGRTRSPASGYGCALELRSGAHRQVLLHTGQTGGTGQSLLPVVLGLGGQRRADYLSLTWPDGVAQAELNLSVDAVQVVREMERRVSSCPVLFTWDGSGFRFIGDFAGVGGLGYYHGPAGCLPPVVRDSLLLNTEQLQPRDGTFELRVCEPMEEVAYVDRLELFAVDAPADLAVYPAPLPPPDDEAGRAPTPAALLVGRAQWRPTQALDHQGGDCTAQLAAVDRVYAYHPPRDGRFVGYCQPHALTLAFEQALSLAGDSAHLLYLVLQGSIEYPYSQTNYAAQQAGLTWAPLQVEAKVAGQNWQTVVADAGSFAGMQRPLVVALPPSLPAGTQQLRLTTNLELYYDQAVLVAGLPEAEAASLVTVLPLPLQTAELRWAGFPLEYSPDGQPPTIYDYSQRSGSSTWRAPAGEYTEYGDVGARVRAFDDNLVIMGPGEEIAASFAATNLPPVAAGNARYYLFVSHAYCKDRDPYTATGSTVRPIPHRHLHAFPPSESAPTVSGEGHTRWRD